VARSTPQRTVTRHRLISSVAGAAALAAALGLLASSCMADGGGASTRRATTLALSSPAEPQRSGEPHGGAPVDREGSGFGEPHGIAQLGQAVDRTVAAPDARTAAAGGPMDVTVYYLRPVGATRYLAPERHEVAFASSPTGVAASAVTELLVGVPRYLGMTRPFPSGTRLLGLGVDDGTATVNLSRQALGGASGDGYAVQALVWTVTQVPPVKRVVVEVEGRSAGVLDGQPLASLLGVGAGGRQLVRDRATRLAPILLASPAPREAVEGGRVVAKGQARVAAGAVGLRLRDPSGRVVSQGYAALPSGAPGWAAFSGALTFLPPLGPQLWTVEAFETSPTDASVIYSVAVPVWVGS
jgi:Sporulation and spore germination/Immunoglobulin-like domain of bacterial spore germination